MMNTLELKAQKMVERCQNQIDAGCVGLLSALESGEGFGGLWHF